MINKKSTIKDKLSSMRNKLSDFLGVNEENAQRAQAHMKIGIDFFQKGNYSAAREELAQGILDVGDNSELRARLLLNLGITCSKLGEYNDSRRWLNEALEIKKLPIDLIFDILCRLAICEYQKHLYPEAYTIWSDIARLYPTQPTIYKVYGDLMEVCWLLGRKEESLGWLTKVMECNTPDPAYRADLNFAAGQRMYKDERYELASQYFMKTIILQPDYPQAHIAFLQAGNCCKQLNRHEESQKFYDQSLACPTADAIFKAKIQYELGVTCFSVDNYLNFAQISGPMVPPR